MTQRTVVITGATGFVGSAITRALAAQPTTRVIALSRTRTSPIANVTPVHADITDRSAIRAALHTADMVIHAAAYSGTDTERADEINTKGTRNLVDAAHSHQINDIVYISSIGVLGDGPFQDVPDNAPARPATHTSLTRVHAENAVTAHGGLVIRPAFTHGPHPNSFTEGLRRITTTLGAVVDGGTARQSTTSVDDLARLVAHIAADELHHDDRGNRMNWSTGEPKTIGELISSLCPLVPADLGALTYEQAASRARHVGLSERALNLVGTEHTFDSGSGGSETAI
ncbi:NAD(P)-dependent oxidoreductase [Gordonia sp. PDNC005]|uniref:NAD-dependent epimerase/dehydratase family protein n=1 Tax=unclassified Gordonia (in: high G+C Gram-positive bacteria) TaxID=2657482 RepID=UPI001965EC84|nr:NAD(P)-dependent oxidoreductase [Gordonia sp. PDNC005]QRY62322.1 NAD(P)-dependent oxidoreductase [Gordonia sp. PDNC005]